MLAKNSLNPDMTMEFHLMILMMISARHFKGLKESYYVMKALYMLPRTSCYSLMHGIEAEPGVWKSFRSSGVRYRQLRMYTIIPEQ